MRTQSSAVDLFLETDDSGHSYSTTIVGGGPAVIASRVHRGLVVTMSFGLSL